MAWPGQSVSGSSTVNAEADESGGHGQPGWWPGRLWGGGRGPYRDGPDLVQEVL